MMAARIFRGLESKQTRACAAHDGAPLTATPVYCDVTTYKLPLGIFCLCRSHNHITLTISYLRGEQ